MGFVMKTALPDSAPSQGNRTMNVRVGIAPMSLISFIALFMGGCGGQTPMSSTAETRAETEAETTPESGECPTGSLGCECYGNDTMVTASTRTPVLTAAWRRAVGMVWYKMALRSVTTAT